MTSGDDELPTDWWTVADTARYLGVSQSTVRTYLARGEMPPSERQYGHSNLWRPKTIRQWHAGRPRKGKTEPS